VETYRFQGGKIAAHWGMNDGMTLMMQLQAGSA
jgi:predicted ester cyclase